MSSATTARPRAALGRGIGLAAARVVPWSGLALIELDEEKRRQQQPAMAGVVGHWTAVDDGGPALLVDGEAWSGTTERAALEASARALFPDARAADSTFVANGAAAGAFPIAVAAAAGTVGDATLRVQFKLVRGATDQIAGIMLGLQPNGEYLFARYNTRDGNVAVWRYADGVRTRVVDGADHEQLALGVWHELVVTVVGSRVIVAVSGTPLRLDETLDRPPIGRVGLWVKRDAVTAFRGFTVTRQGDRSQ